MNEFENFSTRSAIRQLQIIATRELDDLHHDKRDRDQLIASLQNQIKIMRENVECANDRMYQGMKNDDVSTLLMIIAWIAAFVAIGYAVLVSV